MSYWNSLAGRLFKLVFSGYLILAIAVTVVQLALEFSSVQRQIRDDLVSLGLSFNAGVAGAMWELDVPLMQTMARGISQSSIVTGVSITSISGSTVAAVGKTPSTLSIDPEAFFVPFQFDSTVLSRQTATGMRELGKLTIYADRSVALERVKYSFFVILINSLIKTAGLWMIFYLVITKALSRPLSRLTEVVTQFEFAAGAKDSIPIEYPYEDELGRLMGSMQKMQSRLLSAHDELEKSNLSLEETVKTRTHHLSEALDFNEKILVNSPLPMSVYSLDGQCVMTNEAYADLVGGTREAVLKLNFRQNPSWKKSGLLDSCLSAFELNIPQQKIINAVTTFGKSVYLDCRLLPTMLNGREHLLIQFFDLTERKRLEDELREIAFHDPLTLLPNRRLLFEKLFQALRASKRRNSYIALLFLDLNKFKELNDTHGHEIGDQLLKGVADRFQETVRESDTVARLGGDEFVILLEDLGQDLAQAQDYSNVVAQKIRMSLEPEFCFGEVRWQCSASIGIKVSLGKDDDPERLLREADASMYQAKREFVASKPSREEGA